MSRKTVQRTFTALVARARRLGYLPRPVRLRYGPAGDFPARRDHCATDGRTVWAAPKLARASAERVLGLLSHELGHCSALQAGYEDHTEVEADEIGRAILGAPIGYDKQDVQRAGLRRKRPKYLPNPRN